MSKDKEIGTLVVVVLKARNLLDPHSFYKSDVYSQVSLNGETKRTPIDVKGGQHPVWDAELRFPVMKKDAEKFREMKVSCWSKEPRTDENLGEGKVNITETLKTGEFDDWVSLSTEAGGARGDLYLEMTYYSAAPVPAANRLSAAPGADLLRRPSKLSPADRLSRPTQPSPLSTNGAHHSHQNDRKRDTSPHNRPPDNLVPGRTSPPRPSSLSPPKRENGALPALPNDRVQSPTIPSFLLPGAGRGKPSTQPAQPAQPAYQSPPATQPAIPAFLKPGTPSRQPSHTPVAQAAPQQPVQPSHIPGSTAPQYSIPVDVPPPSSYTPVPGPAYTEPQIRAQPVDVNPYLSPPVQHPPVSSVPSSGPDPWASQAPSVPLSFPTPMVSSAVEAVGYHGPPFRAHIPPSPSPSFTRSPPPQSWGNDERDIFRQARYQSPLPLPPGAIPTPSMSTIPEGRVSPSDAARIEAVRVAEREAARRKAQEDRDAELARQLDRELNL